MPSEEISRLPPTLQVEINELFRQVRLPAVANVLWERLTDEQKMSLPYGLTIYCNRFEGAVGIWMQLNAVPRLQAVVEAAHQVDLISLNKQNSLLNRMGLRKSVKSSRVRPVWDATTGELQYDNKVVRSVRSMKKGTNIQLVLTLFEAAEWPRSISAPIDWDQQCAHQTVNELNKKLKGIQFHVRDSGRTLMWQAQDDLQVNSKSSRLD